MSWVRVLITCKLRGLFLASGFECEPLKTLGFECEPLKTLGLEYEPCKKNLGLSVSLGKTLGYL